MKTIAIKMKNYATNVNVVNNNNLQRRVLNIMLWSLGALVFCYVFFLGNMVFNIIERKALETDARSLTNEVGDLESQYFSASNKIDLGLAESMGFKEIRDKSYAVRQPLGSLKIASNEL
jgi:hypothetical protein